MTVLEQLERQDSGVATSVKELDRAFNFLADSSRASALNDLSRAVTRTADQLLFNFTGNPNGFNLARRALRVGGPPNGIFGVGAARYKDELRPAVLLDAQAFGETYGTDPVPLVESGHSDAVSKALQIDLGSEIIATFLPRPTIHSGAVSVGGGISAAGVRGVCGVGVEHPLHGECALTAGHVLQEPGVDVKAEGLKIGESVSADYAGRHSSDAIIADVGVIRIDRTTAFSNPRGPIVQGQAKELDPVLVDTLMGPQSAWIRNVATSFALDRVSGRWGNIFLTDKSVSRDGDSGSPAYLDHGDDFNAFTIIGHVIGGAPPVYTIIQDISFILEAAHVSLP